MSIKTQILDSIINNEYEDFEKIINNSNYDFTKCA